jgi:hypothetical protein
LAGGKVFFADEFFATSSLPTATCNAVGKAFATCFSAFADCFWQSAKGGIPVVTADVTYGSPEEEEDAGTPTTSDVGPRPKRQVRPNQQYAGPEWDV